MKKTILVVDDDIEIVELYKTSFEKDYNVLTAYTGKDALEKCEKEKIDLVILDLGMPDLSGKEILGCIKKKSKDIGIIVVTVEKRRSVAIECMKLGAFDYIVKVPEEESEKKDLFSIVKSYFQQKSDSKVLESNRICLWPDKHKVIVSDEEKHLPTMEFKLLYIIMKKRLQKTINKDKLIKYLYGSVNESATEAFEKLLSRLRTDLGDTKGKIIKTIRNEGIKFCD